MKIIIWGINYAPEPTGIAPYNVALCQFLHAGGHEVRMLTSFPYYPAWKKRPSDRRRLYRTDNHAGVPVHRCWHYVPHQVSSLKRIIHEATFVAFSALRFLTLPSPDVIVVVSPPLLLGAAAWLATRVKRTPFVFHVQDLQPDAAAGLGMLKNIWLIRTLYWLEKFAYAKAARISGIMPAMLEAFRRKRVPEAKLLEFPNGTNLPDPAAFPPRGQFRRRNDFAADDFIALYSGNIGMKQGLEILIDAAQHIRNARIKIVICGEGAQKQTLAQRATKLGLTNVLLLPLQSENEYQEMLVDADLCLITQQKATGNCFFPSKLLTTLAYAKPVLSVADSQSELALAGCKGEFGINIATNDPATLASEIERIVAQPLRLTEMGRSGRRFVTQFEFPSVLRSFEKQLNSLVQPKS